MIFLQILQKSRGNYRCSKCGQPKKGHVCPFQPHFRKRDDDNEDGPDAFDVETQVEMDPEMTVRMLPLDRQGYPDSYIIESGGHYPPSSYNIDSEVVGEDDDDHDGEMSDQEMGPSSSVPPNQNVPLPMGLPLPSQQQDLQLPSLRSMYAHPHLSVAMGSGGNISSSHQSENDKLGPSIVNNLAQSQAVSDPYPQSQSQMPQSIPASNVVQAMSGDEHAAFQQASGVIGNLRGEFSYVEVRREEGNNVPPNLMERNS